MTLEWLPSPEASGISVERSQVRGEPGSLLLTNPVDAAQVSRQKPTFKRMGLSCNVSGYTAIEHRGIYVNDLGRASCGGMVTDAAPTHRCLSFPPQGIPLTRRGACPGNRADSRPIRYPPGAVTVRSTGVERHLGWWPVPVIGGGWIALAERKICSRGPVDRLVKPSGCFLSRLCVHHERYDRDRLHHAPAQLLTADVGGPGS